MRNFKLTYDKKGKRWKKKHKGKQYYFGQRGVVKTDLKSYEAALLEWHEKRVELDGLKTEEHPSIQQRQEKIDWWMSTGMNGDAKIAQQQIEMLKGEIAELKEGGQPISYMIPSSPENNAVWSERRKQMTAKPDELSIGEAITIFMDHKERQVPEKITAARLDCLRCQLLPFAESFGSSMSIHSIDSLGFRKYHDELIDSMKSKRISESYASDILATARQVMQWWYEQEMIDQLPRNLRSRDLTISVSPKKIEVFTDAEVKMILDGASDANRLHYLLMLNCGMTQKDVSDLKPEEIDFEAGTITRKRSKTKDVESVPVVCYRLWDETHRLLKAHAHRTGNHALTNARGGALYISTLKTTGESRLHRVDNISTAYFRLARKLNITKGVKLFRKTSATKIKSLNKGLDTLFLGHSPRSVADKSYSQQNRFPDDDMAWLGTEYGFKTERP